MADDIQLNQNTTVGDKVAADEIGGKKHQRVKIQYGPDGSATDVSDTNPLPIDDAGGSITVDNPSLSVTGGGVEASALRVTLASDSTGVLSVDDNGGSLTVDGTVTANLSTTDNAVLDQIEVNTSYGDQTGGGTETGALRVTLANNSTGVLSVDDNGGSLTIDGTVAANTDATVTDDASYTAATGKGIPIMGFATSATVDAGDVGAVAMDTSRNLKVSIEADNAGIGGGTQYTEDDASAANPVGNMGIAVRADSLSAVTSTDGDNIALRATNKGELYVKQTDGLDVTSVIPGTGNTNLGKAIDSPVGATDTGVMALAKRDDAVTTLAPADGDYTPLLVDAYGRLRVSDGSFQSTNNTTTTPLSSGATYTGTGEQNEYPDVMVSCTTDNTGTLYFDFSVDGTNWGAFPTSGFAVASGIHEFHIAVKGPRYFRVRLVNDTGAQSYLRLYTYFGRFEKPNAPLGQPLNSDSDAIVTKSVISGVDENGTYRNAGTNTFGALQVEPEQHIDIDYMNATTGWSVLNDDTANLATTTKHVLGTAALSFDKVNGTANTVFGAIQKTLTSINFGSIEAHDILQASCYFSSTTNLSYVFVRLGTDSSNYNEWQVTSDSLIQGEFNTLTFPIGDANYSGITGNGWDSSAVTYICVGGAFSTETDTLSGIIFDGVTFHNNMHSAASINAQVTSTVSSSNINVAKVGNKVVDTQSGNVSTGTQRLTIATDDINLAAIKTALEIIDDSIYVDSAAWTATTSRHILSGGVYNASPMTVTDGDTAPIAIDVNGHVITSSHASSIVLSDGLSNTQNIMVDETDSFMGFGEFPFMYNGSTWDRVRGDATNGLTVNLGSNNDVTQTATTSNVGAALMTNVIHNGTTALTPKYAIIDAATSGDNTLVSAVAGKKIRVLQLMIVAAGALTARFEDGAGGTALSGQMNLTTNSGFTLPFSPVGWFETTANTLLNLELSAATSVDGMLVYVEV